MKHYPKLGKTEAIKAIKSGIKPHSYGHPELKKYYDDKDFLLNHIRYSYINISDVSARLQNDKEIIIAWLKKRDLYINNIHLPKICYENEDIIEWILDNKKEESLSFLMSLQAPLQTKERIIQTLGQTLEPLRAKKIKYFEPSKISLKKILGKTSLFEKFHIATWDPTSPIWMKIKKANIYENIELKQEALNFSPGAAFIFMINNEISIEKYANIFVENMFKNRYSMSPRSTYPYYDDGKWEYITTDGFLAISSFSQKEFNSLQDSIFNFIFKKTKDINKIETFLEAFPCFSTTFSQKKIIESIDLNKTSDHYFIRRYYYGSTLKFDKWRNETIEAFLVNNINSAKILHTIKNNPKLAAGHIFEIFEKDFDFFNWRDANKDIANSEQALSFYKTLSKKVYSSKNFLIEFIGVIGFGATSENNPVGANEFAKELLKGMIKYLESTRDFEMLKKIMKRQAEDSNDYTNKASLIYFHISDRLKTSEIIEYFLSLHLGSLDSHSLPTKFDNFDLCLKDQKDFSKALNDEFYFKLVSKHGISCFEIPYMAEKIRHLFDNKEFMINAILKSYKFLKFASDRIKSDPDVVKIAWLKNSKSFSSASATLKKNKVFLNDIFYNEPINIFLNAHHSIRLDADIYLPALKTDISYVSHLTANQILKINTSLFNKSERLSISDEFFKKMNLGDDVLLIAKYKNDFL